MTKSAPLLSWPHSYDDSLPLWLNCVRCNLPIDFKFRKFKHGSPGGKLKGFGGKLKGFGGRCLQWASEELQWLVASIRGWQLKWAEWRATITLHTIYVMCAVTVRRGKGNQGDRKLLVCVVRGP